MFDGEDRPTQLHLVTVSNRAFMVRTLFASVRTFSAVPNRFVLQVIWASSHTMDNSTAHELAELQMSSRTHATIQIDREWLHAATSSC